MTRATLTSLQACVDRLNRVTGSPLEPWTRVDGECAANIGNFHLDISYGQPAVYRMSNEFGGCQCIVSRGTKAQVQEGIWNVIRGYELAKNPDDPTLTTPCARSFRAFGVKETTP